MLLIVNFPILKFGKLGLIEVLTGQEHKGAYDIKTVELKCWVRFDPEAIIRR